MKVRSAWFLRFAFLLGDEKDQLVGFDCGVNRGE
jgi:hypothetical protein